MSQIAVVPVAVSQSSPGSYNTLLVRRRDSNEWSIAMGSPELPDQEDGPYEKATKAFESLTGLAVIGPILNGRTFVHQDSVFWPVQVRSSPLTLDGQIYIDHQWVDISSTKKFLKDSSVDFKIVSDIDRALHQSGLSSRRTGSFSDGPRRKPTLDTVRAISEQRWVMNSPIANDSRGV